MVKVLSKNAAKSYQTIINIYKFYKNESAIETIVSLKFLM